MTITANNASPNDVMMDELAGLVPVFEGRATQVQCFAHIVNLVAKTLLHLFDGKDIEDAELDDADEESGEIEEEEEEEVMDDDDSVDGVATLPEEDLEMLEISVEPLSKVLTKVCTSINDEHTVSNPPTS